MQARPAGESVLGGDGVCASGVSDGGVSKQKSRRAEDPEMVRKRRGHIYWQKSIRKEDTTSCYWFPFETQG